MKKISYTRTMLATFALSSVCFAPTDAFAQGKTLRPLFEEYGITVKSQGSRGTCSIFALTGLIEFERAHVLNERTALSPEYLNWAANRVEGRDADGSFFHYAIDGLVRYGICADDYMPYAVRFSEKNEPSEAAKKDAQQRLEGKQVWIKQWDPNNGVTPEQLQAICKQIDEGHPVAIGFRWPKGTPCKERGELVMAAENDVFDGHSILIVGYQSDEQTPGGGYLVFKNSYGEGFGDGGYGRVPYAYALLYANDAMALHLK